LCRNCPLKHDVDGKIKGRLEVSGRRGTGRKQQMDGLEERRGYWEFKRELLCYTVESWLWERLWMVVVVAAAAVTVLDCPPCH
jgi:hypothetical protein